jgi:hypothetical protein
VWSDAKLINNGTIINHGAIVNKGIITNNGTIDSYDKFEMKEGSELIINLDKKFTNHGVFVNDGSIGGSGTFLNRSLFSGESPQDGVKYIEHGEHIEAKNYNVPDIKIGDSVLIVSDGGEAVKFTPNANNASKIDVTIGGSMAIEIPGNAVTAGAPVTVVMSISPNTQSNVGGTVFFVNVAGVAATTPLVITLPAAGTNSTVHHIVEGTSRGEMDIVSRTSNSVTFTVDHNSEFAVVSSADHTTARHTVTLPDGGTGYFITVPTNTTVSDSLTFRVVPMDGYVLSITATNGVLTQNGYEWTVSGLTDDSVVNISAQPSSSAGSSGNSSTTMLVVAGISAAVVIMVGMFVMNFVKKN